MSPEHAEGTAPPDQHCDLWGLATVAYEALTGELPVSRFSPRAHRKSALPDFRPVHQRNPALPPALAAFFAWAFASPVKDRS
jgi:serine/threonine protein kinase